METILDFSTELNVEALDNVVSTFYTGRGQDQQMAQTMITQFQDHPEAWQRADQILERSQLMQTKYIALQILEKLIQTRWKILPVDQRQGFYALSSLILPWNLLLYKGSELLSLALFFELLQMKQFLGRKRPTELMASSRTNSDICENNMAILKLLSEEIFDFSAEQLTQTKAKDLKNQMCGEFSEIFNLCLEVLEKAQASTLIKATLETLLRFLNWIPLGYIFETQLIGNLGEKFFEPPAFRNVTLKCLTEIGSLQVSDDYNEKLKLLFNGVVSILAKLIPLETDIASVYLSASVDDQDFIQNLAIFFTTFLSAHLKIVECDDCKEWLINAHLYLIKITQVEEREIFKICLEYWSKLVAELYSEIHQKRHFLTMTTDLFNQPNGLPIGHEPNPRLQLYAEILSRLRVTMIERMVRPEEVLIVENDEGEIVREFVKESDTITLYKSMREALVYLTHLDPVDTEHIMTTKLARQMDGSEWSWNNLNKLCWAVGSISGAFGEEAEKRFLVTVIKDLLALCELKRGKDNKAVVASNIMYCVGQYPRFLRAHWKFLKTVVNKLFEFMHELHEGVQDMACDTFIKISQKCRKQFVLQHSGELVPFIDEILTTIPKITADLQPQQVHTFFEAVGYMISAQTNKAIQEGLIAELMKPTNMAWTQLIQQASANMELLENPEVIKQFGNILKLNVAACGSIGSGFYSQIGRIYVDMLGLYKAASELITRIVATQGEIATRTPRVRGLRTIKKEILRLVETYISKADDLNAIVANIIPLLLNAVLGDYNSSIDLARDAEVLFVFASISEILGKLLLENVPMILNAVFGCTLQMISKDLSEFPEHRVGFFKLIRQINLNCYEALLKIPPEQFKLVVDSIIWAIKHTMRDIADIGLTILYELLTNFTRTDAAVANSIYQTYFLMLLQDVLYVLTDSDHKSGFKLQTVVLAKLFSIVECGLITVPLSENQDPSMSNAEFLKQHCINMLVSAFGHVQKAQIQIFVMGLFRLNQDLPKFKLHVRDFLIQLKEFSGDNTDLFLEEKEAELELKKRLELENAMKVPGMLKPSEIQDDNDMD